MDAAERPPITEQVIVLDYGGQYSQLIARRVRECGVFSELLPHHVGAEEVARRKPKGVILSGGPASVYEPGAPALDRELLELGIPVLGICYGMQLIARELGGRVEGAEVGEFGRSQLAVSRAGPAAGGDAAPSRRAGCRTATRCSPRRRGSRALASSTASPVAAFESVRPRDLRDPVPPGGRPHALRTAGPDELPGGRLRLRAELERELGDRGSDRADPRTGGRRAGDLRPIRRRRLERRRAARPPRDRRPADMRVRRPRPDAQERGRPGGRRLPRPLPRAAGGGRRLGSLPGEARRRDRPRGEAQADRRRVHPRVRGGGREAGGASTSSSRGRCTPT